MRKDKVDGLVKAVTKLGHEVRKDENSDKSKVDKAKEDFKAARQGATKAEEKEAWRRVGPNGTHDQNGKKK